MRDLAALRLDVLDAVLELRTDAPPGAPEPFVLDVSQLIINIFAKGSTEEAALAEALLCPDEESLPSRVRTKLANSGCKVSPNLRVDVFFVKSLPAPDRRRGFQLAYVPLKPNLIETPRLENAAPKPAEQAVIKQPEHNRLRIRVERGVADCSSISIPCTRFNIGRKKELRNINDGCVFHINHLAFRDNGDEVNSTISRQHAYVDWDEDRGKHILHAGQRPPSRRSGRLLGTNLWVIRGGDEIEVPFGAAGISLKPGDRIRIGQAMLAVESESGSGQLRNRAAAERPGKRGTVEQKQSTKQSDADPEP
jgi:hypothetical protein